MLSRRIINFSKSIYAKYSTETKNVVSTALYQLHVDQGGKIVNFAGYFLPVQYNDLSITQSHIYTRTNASLFDVSHMLQTEITGTNCIKFFERLCTADINSMKENTSVLTVFTNNSGGILDDLIITKINDQHLYIVSNANRKLDDQRLILDAFEDFKKSDNGTNIKIHFFEPSERSLLALQGPKSADVLQAITDVPLKDLYFMNSTTAIVDNVEECRITRCGYTGEDGFEISIPSNRVNKVAKTILRNTDVTLAGLGARDSLRLEAGLCLYGNDITERISPIEAGLTWLVAKPRRERKDFPGADIIVDQIKNGCRQKRVGFILESGPPARHNTLVFNNETQKQIGIVTSGCPGPSLGKNIAMGYVSSEFSKVGTRLKLKIRERYYDTVITKMPFVKANYYNKPK